MASFTCTDNSLDLTESSNEKPQNARSPLDGEATSQKTAQLLLILSMWEWEGYV